MKTHLKPLPDLLRGAGLDEDGAVQVFYTQNCLHRILKYMPFDTGLLIKLTLTQTDIRVPEIVTEAPGAVFLYHGRLMLGEETHSPYAKKNESKYVTAIPLEYGRGKNPQAGPYWDRALTANEQAAMEGDLQRYVDDLARRRP